MQTLMLPGQAAAPEGPCDLNAMYVLHHGFRRDLQRFAAAAAATPEDDVDRWRALRERWAKFSHLLHDHHSKEDEVLWPLLLERADAAGDREARAVLDAMEAEHALIDPLLIQARCAISRLADGDPAARGELVGVLARAAVVLDQHLGHEEREAVAVMQRYIGAEEWRRLENGPLRGNASLGEVLYLMPWAAEGLAPEVLDAVKAQAGLPFRMMLRLGRRSFARLEADAFSHVV